MCVLMKISSSGVCVYVCVCEGGGGYVCVCVGGGCVRACVRA